MTDTTPTPSAPTAEMLAQEARQLEPAETDREIELLTIIDRLAALARSEPPTAPAWPNGCNRTIPEALRFLAANRRPSGGQERFNAEHLLQLAEEIERAVKRAEPPTGEPVAISDERISDIWNAEFVLTQWGQTGDSPVHRFSRALLAEARAPVAIPEGWKLVPIKPTNEMLRAGLHADAFVRGETPSLDAPQAVWVAMLAVSPPIEAQAPFMLNGLTEAETAASASVAGLVGADNARRLVCDLWMTFPTARTAIEHRTGAWFVWGSDRDSGYEGRVLLIEAQAGEPKP